MFSEREQYGYPRRSLSNYKQKSKYVHSSRQPPKKYLSFAKLLKTVIRSKLKNYLTSIKEQSDSHQHLQQKLTSMMKIVRTVSMRKGFTSLNFALTQNIKKTSSVKMISNALHRMIKDRKKLAYTQLKLKHSDKKFDKFYSFTLQRIDKLMTTKIKINKHHFFHTLRTQSNNHQKFIKKLSKFFHHMNLKHKSTSFMKICLKNINSKISSLQIEHPTQQSQQNIKYIEGLEQDEKKEQFHLLKKSTSDTNLNNITQKLKDSIDQKRKRSLSRKSRVSSLMDEDFTLILAASYSNKDYRCYQNTKEEQKLQYYKNMAKTYKKQLDLAKKELDVMKQLNENYQVEIEGIIDSRQAQQIHILKQKVAALEKDKQKYRERSRRYQKKIVEMNEQFKSKMQILQMKVKKQF